MERAMLSQTHLPFQYVKKWKLLSKQRELFYKGIIELEERNEKTVTWPVTSMSGSFSPGFLRDPVCLFTANIQSQHILLFCKQTNLTNEDGAGFCVVKNYCCVISHRFSQHWQTSSQWMVTDCWYCSATSDFSLCRLNIRQTYHLKK